MLQLRFNSILSCQLPNMTQIFGNESLVAVFVLAITDCFEFRGSDVSCLVTNFVVFLSKVSLQLTMPGKYILDAKYEYVKLKMSRNVKLNKSKTHPRTAPLGNTISYP